MKKKLSDITNRDAIAVAMLFNSEYEWFIKDNDDSYVVVECDDYRIYIWKDEIDFIEFEELYTGKQNISAHGCESEPCSPYRTIIDIIDYLRHQGYDLPNKFEKIYTEKDLINAYNKVYKKSSAQWSNAEFNDDDVEPSKEEFFKDNFGIIIENI